VKSLLELVNAGVNARLFVWEAMDHGFFGNPDLPELREAYSVIVHIFDRHFGTKPPKGGTDPLTGLIACRAGRLSTCKDRCHTDLRGDKLFLSPLCYLVNDKRLEIRRNTDVGKRFENRYFPPKNKGL
jgi:hypothetical protein